jgi:hypothetical protein
MLISQSSSNQNSQSLSSHDFDNIIEIIISLYSLSDTPFDLQYADKIKYWIIFKNKKAKAFIS